VANPLLMDAIVGMFARHSKDLSIHIGFMEADGAADAKFGIPSPQPISTGDSRILLRSEYSLFPKGWPTLDRVRQYIRD